MIKDLPSRIKELRIRLGYSQKQVAQLLGFFPSIISDYETGERTPSTEMILSLQCSTDYLLGKKTASSPSTLDVTGLSNEEIRALRTLVSAIRKEGKEGASPKRK